MFLLLLSCTGGGEREVRECVADDCACQADSDCVIDECYYYEPATEDDCFLLECDCSNGWPIPAAERDRIVSVRADICALDQIPSPTGCYDPCGNVECSEFPEFRAECRVGVCVGVW